MGEFIEAIPSDVESEVLVDKSSGIKSVESGKVPPVSLNDLPVLASITKSWPLQTRETYTDSKGEYYYFSRIDDNGDPILDIDGDEVLGRIYIYEKNNCTFTR